ncbi:MAG: acyl-CoA dehydrogenase, partial [Ilumatobacteraceae bacterium]|nr:acyl-CoA dehydrogenase [Ilumatobacteraceae bacterium]
MSTLILTDDEQKVIQLTEELLREFPPKTTDAVTFLGAQYDKGLAWVHFEVGCGGLGLNPKLQRQINEQVFAAGAPNPVGRNPIGHGMCGPTVAV